MMKSELISVIIINWNGKKWLEKCLGALSNQTYKNLEILVVDNASSDDSVGYVSKNFPKVRVIENRENLGFAQGNNIGIKLSKGKYILRIDSDTWVEENFIEKLLNFYENNDFDVVGPREKRYDKSGSIKGYSPVDFLGNPAYGQTIGYKLFALSGMCLMFRKEFYFDTLGFDSDFFMYFEDIDWFWRLNLLSKKFTICESVYVYHYGSGSTNSKGLNYKLFLWRNQNVLQMLLKNYSLLSLIFILPIYFLQNLIEILFFLIILKPKIAYSYLEGWIFNFTILRKTLKKRNWIQSHRNVSDLVILRKMYFIPTRLTGLLMRIKQVL